MQIFFGSGGFLTPPCRPILPELAPKGGEDSCPDLSNGMSKTPCFTMLFGGAPRTWVNMVPCVPLSVLFCSGGTLSGGYALVAYEMAISRVRKLFFRGRILQAGDPRKVRGLQTRPNSHLPAREAPKDQNRHVQIRAPKPSCVSSEQEQTYTNSRPSWKTPQRRTYSRRGGCKFGWVWSPLSFKEQLLPNFRL